MNRESEFRPVPEADRVIESKTVEMPHHTTEQSVSEREPFAYTERLVLAGNLLERLYTEIATDPSRVDWLKKWVPGLGPYLYYREGKTGEFPSDKPGEKITLSEKQRMAAYLIASINLLAAGASYSGNKTVGWTAVGVAAAVDVGRFAGPEVYKSAAAFYRTTQEKIAEVMDRMAVFAENAANNTKGLTEEE